MKRYTPWPNDRWIDTPLGQFVLASDAEAAIAAAEQRGRDRERAEMAKPLDALVTFAEGAQSTAFAAGLVQGQRDMLARCIAAVEALDVCWYVDDSCQSPNHGILNDVYLALRALAENP